MKKLIFSLIFIMILNLSVITAEVEDFGTFKLNSCINIPQTCQNCSYVNVTKIQAPDGFTNINKPMTKNGANFNYTFCANGAIGKYIVTTCGDVDGLYTCVDYTYEVTPSGFAETLGFYFILILLCGSLVGLGFYVKDGWFVTFGGLGLIMVGLYSINFGIAGMRDMFITWGMGLFLMGIGAYLAINSTLELINEGLN